MTTEHTSTNETHIVDEELDDELNDNVDEDQDVSELSDECGDKKVKEVVTHANNSKELNLNNDFASLKVKQSSEETLPPRAPHSLFLGRPNDKPRRNRGSRKKTNKSNNSISDKTSQVSKPAPNKTSQSDDPTSKQHDIASNTDNKKSQLAEHNQDSSTKPVASVNQPSTPANRKTSKIAKKNVDAANTVAKGQSVTFNDLLEMYGSNPGINHPSQPWNQRRGDFSKPEKSIQSKRPLSNKNSPENMPKRSKTYAEVLTDDLVLFITDKSGAFDETKSQTLERKLMEKFFNYLSTNPRVAPTYHSSSIRFGSLKMLCTDRFSAEWFTRVINELPAPWEGAILEIESADFRKKNPKPKPARRPTIRFFIPDGMLKPDFEMVKKALKAQNQPLNTDDWSAWKQEEQEYGTFYHVSANEVDVEFINGKGGRLFFCFHKIKIITPKSAGDAADKDMEIEGNN